MPVTVPSTKPKQLSSSAPSAATASAYLHKYCGYKKIKFNKFSL